MSTMEDVRQQMEMMLGRQTAAEVEIARLNSQNQAANDEINRLTAQNAAFAAQGLEALPRLVASLESRQRAPTLVDTRGLGRPDGFKGRDGEWNQWSRKFENYVSACHAQADVAME